MSSKSTPLAQLRQGSSSESKESSLASDILRQIEEMTDESPRASPPTVAQAPPEEDSEEMKQIRYQQNVLSQQQSTIEQQNAMLQQQHQQMQQMQQQFAYTEEEMQLAQQDAKKEEVKAIFRDSILIATLIVVTSLESVRAILATYIAKVPFFAGKSWVYMIIQAIIVAMVVLAFRFLTIDA